MFSQLSENLTILMAKRRLSVSELARETGVPASTLKKIKGAHQTNPTLSTLEPLARFFDISLEQLLLGQLDGSLQEQHAVLLPVLTWEEILKWPMQPLKIRKRIATEQQAHFALEVKQLQSDKFSPGTLLILKTDIAPTHGDYLIIHIIDQSCASLKQLWQEDGVNYLKSLSLENHTMQMTEKHRVIGVVLELRQSVKN